MDQRVVQGQAADAEPAGNGPPHPGSLAVQLEVELSSQPPGHDVQVDRWRQPGGEGGEGEPIELQAAADGERGMDEAAGQLHLPFADPEGEAVGALGRFRQGQLADGEGHIVDRQPAGAGQGSVGQPQGRTRAGNLPDAQLPGGGRFRCRRRLRDGSGRRRRPQQVLRAQAAVGQPGGDQFGPGEAQAVESGAAPAEIDRTPFQEEAGHRQVIAAAEGGVRLFQGGLQGGEAQALLRIVGHRAGDPEAAGDGGGQTVGEVGVVGGQGQIVELEVGLNGRRVHSRLSLAGEDQAPFRLQAEAEVGQVAGQVGGIVQVQVDLPDLLVEAARGEPVGEVDPAEAQPEGFDRHHRLRAGRRGRFDGLRRLRRRRREEPGEVPDPIGVPVEVEFGVVDGELLEGDLALGQVDKVDAGDEQRQAEEGGAVRLVEVETAQRGVAAEPQLRPAGGGHLVVEGHRQGQPAAGDPDRERPGGIIDEVEEVEVVEPDRQRGLDAFGEGLELPLGMQRRVVELQAEGRLDVMVGKIGDVADHRHPQLELADGVGLGFLPGQVGEVDGTVADHQVVEGEVQRLGRGGGRRRLSGRREEVGEIEAPRAGALQQQVGAVELDGVEDQGPIGQGAAAQGKLQAVEGEEAPLAARPAQVEVADGHRQGQRVDGNRPDVQRAPAPFAGPGGGPAAQLPGKDQAEGQQGQDEEGDQGEKGDFPARHGSTRLVRGVPFKYNQGPWACHKPGGICSGRALPLCRQGIFW